MDSAADKKIKSRAKLPSWMIEEEPEVQKEVVLSPKTADAIPSAADSAANGEDVLLGAPKATYAAESDEFCAPSSSSEALSEVEVPPGFAAIADHEVKISSQSTESLSDSKANAEVAKEADARENEKEA